MKKVRTRYAPSPTGHLHIGGARTALFSYLFAKHFDGEFIVRMEDTDLSRNIENGESSQLDNLLWLGIIPDESPIKPNKKYGSYRQSEKLKRYNEIINQLLENNQAYKAYETPEELDEQRKQQENHGQRSFRYDKKSLVISSKEKNRRDEAGEYTIRLGLPKNKTYFWNDIVRGTIEVNSLDIGDYVIRKKNGYPTYNFAVVVDDHDMEISHVLRGEEHITNTPKQLAIYDLMSWKAPQFGHLTIITNNDGKKLSKRDKSVKQFIEDYKLSGYDNHAIFNFLTLLGWTHPKAKEIMSQEEIIRSFDPNRLSKSPSKFDHKKMEWFSKEYLKKTPNKVLIAQLSSNQNEKWLNLFVDIYKQSAFKLQDLQSALKIYDDHSVKQIENSNIVNTFKHELFKLDFIPENIQIAINETKKITKMTGKNLFMPIRLATTYQQHGPELAKAIYLFGEETIKRRLK